MIFFSLLFFNYISFCPCCCCCLPLSSLPHSASLVCLMKWWKKETWRRMLNYSCNTKFIWWYYWFMEWRRVKSSTMRREWRKKEVNFLLCLLCTRHLISASLLRWWKVIIHNEQTIESTNSKRKGAEDQRNLWWKLRIMCTWSWDENELESINFYFPSNIDVRSYLFSS